MSLMSREEDQEVSDIVKGALPAEHEAGFGDSLLGETHELRQEGGMVLDLGRKLGGHLLLQVGRARLYSMVRSAVATVFPSLYGLRRRRSKPATALS